MTNADQSDNGRYAEAADMYSAARALEEAADALSETERYAEAADMYSAARALEEAADALIDTDPLIVAARIRHARRPIRNVTQMAISDQFAGAGGSSVGIAVTSAPAATPLRAETLPRGDSPRC